MELIYPLVLISIWFVTAHTLKKRGKSFAIRNIIAFFLSVVVSTATITALDAVGVSISVVLILMILGLLLVIGSEKNLQDEKLKAENERLQQEYERAKPYLQIADAELEAKNILAQAQEDASQIKQNAEMLAEKLGLDAKSEYEAAKHEAEAYKNEQFARVDQEILDLAGSKESLQDQIIESKELLIAIENQINGYGDEWVVPPPSFIDELAEEYSFKEVGELLKNLRHETRMMIKTDMAADCDYVEPQRRETAMRFVIDAYNGKIDTILAKAKTENYGVLKQQMQDAFILVNSNGRAFRNARITRSFHLKRQKELEYIIAINQIKLAEREEQRRIREQIREEEKAAREYERAIKEAKREEEIIAKAIAKKQAEMEAANAIERAALESQLAELHAKYIEAEAKNQRALSMAQQTKSGHVYVISNIGSFGEDVFKIGMTRRLEPHDRIRELGDASVPFAFDVHAMIYSDNAPALEYELHKLMQDNQVNKVNPRKEFFRVPLSEIKAHIQRMGLEVHWTLTAEAAEYRQTQAMERMGVKANILDSAEGLDD